MSSDKTLDNTEISSKDAKEMQIGGADTKLDKTSATAGKKSSSSSRSSRSRSKSNQNKSPKDQNSSDVSDSSTSHEATVPKDAKNPAQSSVDNIKGKLSDPKIQQEFIINVADLLQQYSRRKLTQDEVHDLQEIVDKNLLQKVFKIGKQLT
jgi:hypothetical protein